MHTTKKIFLLTFLCLNFFSGFSSALAGEAETQPSTGIAVLPVGNSCESKYTSANYLLLEEQHKAEVNNLIGCAIKNGEIHIWMIPYFLKYLAEFLIGLAGILCMLFIVIGGYHYVLGGISEEKEKGKKTVIYAIMGLAMVLLSWTIVNIVLFVVTG